MPPPSLVGVTVVVLLVLLALRRANELCVLEIANGEARLLRGRAPPRLVSDAREIARRAPAGRVVLAVVSEGGVPRVVVRRGEPSAELVQRLRNVTGQHRVPEFRRGAARP